MTFPYVIEDNESVKCLCKGCGEILWVSRGGACQRTAAYCDLTIAMQDADHDLSQHSTPCCPACGERAVKGEVDLEAWWGADVFHWFIEERVLGKDPDESYRVATKLAGDRHPVRALRCVRPE